MQIELDALDQLKEGVDALANPVAVTMGPRGRNVVIKRYGQPAVVTKDGVTVAESIVDLSDPIQSIGAEMVREVASRANKLAGDGTTTATILAQEMVRLGVKNIAAGANQIEIKRGMDKAVAQVVARLEEDSIKIELGGEEVKQVAAISANNDPEVGELISSAFQSVGKDGVVTVEPSPTHLSYVDIVKGMQFDRGWVSPMFPTNEAGTIAELENPMFVLCDSKITKIDDVVGVMHVAMEKGRPLVIIAEDISGPALSQLVVNKVHGSLKSVAIKAPGFSKSRFDYLVDIATVVGSTVFSERTGFKLSDVKYDEDTRSVQDFDPGLLGGAEGITVEQNSTVIVNGKGTDVDLLSRVEELKDQRETLQTSSEIKLIDNRIAKLSGGVGVVYVGANSTVEASEKKDRADDALRAVQSAIQEGIVPGGGIALLNAAKAIDMNLPGDQAVGAGIIYNAMLRPLYVISENAGASGDVIIEGVISRPTGTGWNAKTGEYVEMISEGIIDPKMVTRVALESANSAAGMVILTECAIFE